MGWLIGPTIASAMVAFLAVRIFGYIFGEASSGVAKAAQTGVFVTAYTVVTTALGMSGFRKRVRKLRQGNASAINALIRK